MSSSARSRSLIMLPRIPQWWIAVLALSSLGAVLVTGTFLLTALDVAYRLESARIAAVITNGDGVEKIGGFCGARLLVNTERPGWVDFDSGVRGADAQAPQSGMFMAAAWQPQDALAMRRATSFRPERVPVGQVATGVWPD